MKDLVGDFNVMDIIYLNMNVIILKHWRYFYIILVH